MNARTTPRTVVFLALLLLVPPALAAQELTGTVRLADGTTPAAGIVLEATRPADGRILGRSITGENGGFLLRVAAGEFNLRALRIGHRPTDLGAHTLAAGERRRTDFNLANNPVVLAAVTSRADSRCEVGGRVAERVATIFDEARKALLASQLTPPEGRPQARILLERGVLEPNGRPRVPPTRVVGSGFAARPFRSAPPTQLAALGYAIEENDGTSYFAPDANVILSDQFAAAHCLRMARPDDKRPDRIGIAFEPVGRAEGRVRIKGTIWLREATLVLERLEFAYVGLPARLDDANLGGSIEFAQLPDGMWFEDRWEIRMPRMSIDRSQRVRAIDSDGSGDIITLESVHTAGGRVLSIERPDRVLYASVGDEPELRTATDPDAMRTAEMVVRAACSTAAVEGEPRSTVVGLVLQRDARPAVGSTVTSTWQEQFRVDPRGGISWRERTLTATAAEDGYYSFCGVPRERRFVLQARAGERRSPSQLRRFEANVDYLRADIRFVADP